MTTVGLKPMKICGRKSSVLMEKGNGGLNSQRYRDVKRENEKLDMNRTHEPNEFSILVKPSNPNFKARMLSFFSQNSPNSTNTSRFKRENTIKNL